MNSRQPETFGFELREDGTAQRNAEHKVPAAHGEWEYTNGEAVVCWNDGWKDILRCAGKNVEKLAFFGDRKNPEDIAPAYKES